MESPAPRYSMRVCTGTRVPAKTGAPLKTSGEEVTTGLSMAACYDPPCGFGKQRRRTIACTRAGALDGSGILHVDRAGRVMLAFGARRLMKEQSSYEYGELAS